MRNYPYATFLEGQVRNPPPIYLIYSIIKVKMRLVLFEKSSNVVV